VVSASTRSRGSIVIPAHNEAAVIVRCLTALHRDVDLAGVEVIVSCNGCTDRTADLARSTGYPVQVLETDEASKVVALRRADAVATAFPRIYLDADIVLEGRAALAVLDRLDVAEALAGRPPIRFDSSRATWPVRSYYRARSRVPTVMGALWGAGVYALSASARGRFGEFPDLVADDLFIDGLFTQDERVIVDTAPVVVSTPRRLGALLTILRRTYRGNAQQHDLAASRTGGAAEPAVGASTSSSVARQVVLSARTPSSAIDATVYLAIAVIARIATALRPAPRWERDDSSREV
jgi:glycosyltransferase involved in cell wall biosynthesis